MDHEKKMQFVRWHETSKDVQQKLLKRAVDIGIAETKTEALEGILFHEAQIDRFLSGDVAGAQAEALHRLDVLDARSADPTDFDN